MVQYYTFARIIRNVKFELGTLDVNFGFNEERIAKLSLERVWLHETIGKMEHFSAKTCVGGYRFYKTCTPLVFAYLNERYWPSFLVVLLPCSLSVHFLHHHTWGLLEKGDRMDQGHCQQGTSSEREPNVSTCRQRCSVGGKFRGWKIS